MRRVNRQPDGSEVPADGAATQTDNTPQTEEITLTVAEYKAADGLMLPHRITRTAADGAREVWEIKTFRLNAPKAAGLK